MSGQIILDSLRRQQLKLVRRMAQLCVLVLACCFVSFSQFLVTKLLSSELVYKCGTGEISLKSEFVNFQSIR